MNKENMLQIRGIIPPVATPMLANEDLDLPRFRWFLDHLIGEGVHGLFVLGTNSEFYALDETEKQHVIATAVELVAKRVPVFAGTGAETTREVVRLTKMAEREGADGVSVITPYFIAPTQQEIFDHYRRIAESTSLPVILYNNPSTCGGVKIQGRDTLIYPSLLFGAQGAVPASANVAPGLAVLIFEAFQRGDHASAKAAQLRLNPIRLSLNLGTAPGGVKAALDLLGMSLGPSRSPIAPLSSDKREKMRAALQQAGLLGTID